MSAPTSSSSPGSRALITVGFDTATDDTAACAMRDGEVVYEALLGLSEKGGPRHTTALLEEVERAAAAVGGWDAVERIAVGVGPGSFTGLRVGIATARALGFSRGVAVRGAGTLDALGRGLGEAAGERRCLAVLDARRGEVAAAVYSAAGERLWGPWLGTAEELTARIPALPEAALCGGPGAVRFRQQLASRGVEIPDDADPVHRVAARHVCALAAPGPGEEESHPVAPIYLRPPDAERWRERDSLQEAE